MLSLKQRDESSGLSDDEWRALVDQLSALRAGDLESAVMAVRMRRRKRFQEEENRAGGCDGASTCG